MTLRSVALRFFLYTLAVLVFFHGMVVLQSQRQGARFFSDNEPVENAQILLLLSTAIVLVLSGWVGSMYRHLAFVLVALPLAALLRELDDYFDLIGKNAWFVAVLLVLLAMVIYWMRHKADVKRAIVPFCSSSAFGYFGSGFLIVMWFSRLVGQQEFWKTIQRHNYDRDVPRVVEEVCETAGYFLLLFGAIEMLALCRQTAAQVSTEPTSTQQQSQH